MSSQVGKSSLFEPIGLATISRLLLVLIDCYRPTMDLKTSETWNNWQGTGQSIARDIAKGKAGVFDAHKLVGHWFNQILYFDPEAVKSFG